VFDHNFDHEGNSKFETEQALEHIDVLKIAQSGDKGNECLPNNWIAVHWKTFLDDGKLIEDSRKHHKKLPTVF